MYDYSNYLKVVGPANEKERFHKKALAISIEEPEGKKETFLLWNIIPLPEDLIEHVNDDEDLEDNEREEMF